MNAVLQGLFRFAEAFPFSTPTPSHTFLPVSVPCFSSTMLKVAMHTTTAEDILPVLSAFLRVARVLHRPPAYSPSPSPSSSSSSDPSRSKNPWGMKKQEALATPSCPAVVGGDVIMQMGKVILDLVMFFPFLEDFDPEVAAVSPPLFVDHSFFQLRDRSVKFSKQEDAHEYLEFLLNRLHDELTAYTRNFCMNSKDPIDADDQVLPLLFGSSISNCFDICFLPTEIL
jgi:hypothetical protein